MTNPFLVFPTHLDGLYHRVPRLQAEDAIKMGWIPVSPTIQGVLDLIYHDLVWLRAIECACGRIMPPLPLEVA